MFTIIDGQPCEARPIDVKEIQRQIEMIDAQIAQLVRKKIELTAFANTPQIQAILKPVVLEDGKPDLSVDETIDKARAGVN